MEKIKSIDDVHQKEIAKKELKMLNIGFSMAGCPKTPTNQQIFIFAYNISHKFLIFSIQLHFTLNDSSRSINFFYSI